MPVIAEFVRHRSSPHGSSVSCVSRRCVGRRAGRRRDIGRGRPPLEVSLHLVGEPAGTAGSRSQRRSAAISSVSRAARASSGSSIPDPRGRPATGPEIGAQAASARSAAAGIVEQGAITARRHGPPAPGLRVQVPDLEIARRPDLREQGRQVVGEVVGGGRRAVRDGAAAEPQPAAKAQPAAERPSDRSSRRISISGASRAHRVQAAGTSSPGRVGGPPVRAGSSYCQTPAGCSSIRWPPAPARGVGEGGDQGRADRVQQVPPLANRSAVPDRWPSTDAGDGAVRRRLHVDLHRCGRAHHRRPRRAPGVEVPLHGDVPGIVGDPVRPAGPGRRRGRPGGRHARAARRTQRRRSRATVSTASVQIVPGAGAELDLPTGFHRHACRRADHHRTRCLRVRPTVLGIDAAG